MRVTGYGDPLLALENLHIDNYDLVILDLNLPNMDGLEVCRVITQKYHLPIIISSARSDITDRVIGLELGADDYLPKPYDLRELVARIQTIIRRVKNSPMPHTSNFEICETQMQINHNGTILDLTLAEYEILKLMLEKKQIVLSREYIANNIDAIGWDSCDKSIDVIIGRIRHKLEDTPKNPKYIKTIRGIGYKFIGD
jgi:two-component system OmpR family response regulator